MRGTIMGTFRTSLTARLASISVTIALVGGGFVALAGTDPWLALPGVLLASITMMIAALILGVYDHPAEVLLLAILTPGALLPYVLVNLWVIQYAPSLGALLVGVGVVPLALTL